MSTPKKKARKPRGESRAERKLALAWALERLAGASETLAEAIGFLAVEIGEHRRH